VPDSVRLFKKYRISIMRFSAVIIRLKRFSISLLSRMHKRIAPRKGHNLRTPLKFHGFGLIGFAIRDRQKEI
jgi:hypothetical protein